MDIVNHSNSYSLQYEKKFQPSRQKWCYFSVEIRELNPQMTSKHTPGE